MNIVFLADFFKDELLGGAEMNDGVLISYLRDNNFKIETITCNQLTEEKAILTDFFIVSNFVGLSEKNKQIIMMKKYIIYEHDHKYLRSRDPSVYKDFKAPPHDIVNKKFYQSAQKVIVLSKICKEIIEKNLGLTNVHSIGCSLWSDKKLDFIESLSTNQTEKVDKFCIINSSNIIKGTREAINHCENNDIEYELIGPLPENELLTELSKYKYFIFFPKVLETLSRITVEAKMLDCKLLTIPSMLGASSEDWFKLSGKNLIDQIRIKRDAALKKFAELIDDTSDITVILNCYRRPEYLTKQIEAIRNQTIQPKQIWIWVNYHDDNKDIDFSKFDVDRVIKNDYNWKFYGRFAGALLADTKYIAMFDDDTIPGSKWFENCANTMKQNEGILGGAGVKLKNNRYYGHDRFGWSSKNEELIEVDLVGHAWYFKRDWLKYLWLEKPFTWDNGEDIQFSYMAQKHGNVKTYCPPHPESDKDMSSSLLGYELGVDEKATSNQRNHVVFYSQRDACVKNAIMNGWKPVFMRIENV